MTYNNAMDARPLESGSVVPADDRQKLLAMGHEFAKRCFEAESLDDLFLILTNDIRVIVQFDRSALITHIGGESKFVSAANQPILQSKSGFHELLSETATPLKALHKGVFLAGKSGTEGLTEDLPEAAKEALRHYLQVTSCNFLLCVPLRHNDMNLGHLLLEFLSKTPPNQASILTVLNIAPFLAAAMAEKWLKGKKPSVFTLLDPEFSAIQRRAFFTRYGPAGLIVLGILLLVFFVVPFPFDVGGEAEIVPRNRHVSFCKMDGIIDKVKTSEGSKIRNDQVLAVLDSKELDYKIRTAETQFDVLTKEMLLLRNSASEDPSKLAESNLVELKRKVAWEELDFHKWQRQFLEIKAPVDGIVLTKDIESLAGKKLRAGEVFCEIVAPGELAVDVFVPEDRVAYVEKGQVMTVYLAGTPRKGIELQVEEIAPMAEATARLGNIYRVRGMFPFAPPSTMVGMKGIGRIHGTNSSLWNIVGDRLLSRWQKWSLHF